MAQAARNEQQPMSQRGTSTREAGNGDFDFEFNAASRQERQLMRQRGAGSRQINNIDFGFAFTTPNTVRGRRSRTRSKTPGTVTRQPTNSRTTPVTVNVDELQQYQSSIRSARSGRGVNTGQQDHTTGQSLRKRRRLSEVSNLAGAVNDEFPLRDEHHNTIEEEQEPLGDMHGESGMSSGPHDYNLLGPPSSPLFLPNDGALAPSGADKENDTSKLSAQKLGPKKRKRKSIGQQSLFKKKRNSAASQQAMATPPDTQEEAQQSYGEILQDSKRDSSAWRDRRWSVASSEPPPGPTPISSPAKQAELQPVSETDLQPQGESERQVPTTQAKRRKKRKSVVQGKTKRRSSGAITSAPSRPDNSVEVDDDSELRVSLQEEQDEQDELSSLHSSEESQEIDPDDISPRSDRRTAVSSSRSSRYGAEQPNEAKIHDDSNDADADETYLPDEGTPEPTPAPKSARQKKMQKRQRSLSKRRPRSTTAPRPSGIIHSSQKSTFPILTHRLTNIRLLPTINEGPEDAINGNQLADPDADELALPRPTTLTTRSTPNAVDVLAQVCRENIDSAITNLKDQSRDLPRKELNQRLTALLSFRDTLDTSLFDLSQSLDQRLTMEARLRKSRREKAEVQAQWLEIRKRRDVLEVRKDMVRRKHWEGEVLASKRFRVSQAAFGVEAAVSRDEDGYGNIGDGLETDLREIAKDIGMGGILDTLKEFNRRLEKLADGLS